MQEGYFATSDLGLAAALITWGYSIKKVHKVGRKSEFFFQFTNGDALIKQVTADYWDSQLRLFFDNLKMLKSRIYSK